MLFFAAIMSVETTADATGAPTCSLNQPTLSPLLSLTQTPIGGVRKLLERRGVVGGQPVPLGKARCIFGRRPSHGYALSPAKVRTRVPKAGWGTTKLAG